MEASTLSIQGISRVKRSERAGPGYLSRAHQLLDRSTAVQHGDGVTEPIGMDGPEELGSCPPKSPVFVVGRNCIETAEHLGGFSDALSADQCRSD